MGGHTGGAIAGQTACKTFTEVFAAASTPPEARLKTALQASNEALAKGVEQNAALKGMGCTIVAAWIDDLGIRWTSVGDFLLLLYRLPDVIRLNADHSLGSFLDEQARQNKITRSEARRNRNRNALRSALTGSKIDLIDLRSEPLELRAGDWVLLASDGICSLPGDEIADVVYRFRQSTPEEMADGLIAAVDTEGRRSTRTTPRSWPCASMRPTTSRRASSPGRRRARRSDLRTRRIGVSRRGPANRRGGGEDARRRSVAGCGRRAHLLRRRPHPRRCRRCGRRYLPIRMRRALPRPNRRRRPPRVELGSRHHRSGQAFAPQADCRAAGPGRSSPAAPPDKAPSTGEGQEGAAQPVPPSKSVALPPPTSPPASASEGEEGATSRSAASKPSASPPVPPVVQSPAPPPEGEEPGARTSAPKHKRPNPPPAARRPAAKAAGTAPATPAARKPAVPAESSAPRQSKELSRAKPAPAPGPTVEEPKENLPGTDSLNNVTQ